MPGIVGLISKMPRAWAEPQLARMVKALGHEPFYESGTWIDESLGLYVGWTAAKGSFAQGMPLVNELGDISLIFSGEDYPHPDTVRQLRDRGHCFAAEGSSYLVHAYEEDQHFPANLNGMFHGLVVDRRRATAMLFTDRYGMHRLHSHESSEAFYFAAEAKAILAVRPELRTPDNQGLGEFVAFNCVLENRTIFKDIRVMPAASAWTIRGGTIESRRTYFEPKQWEEQSALDPESYYKELRDVLAKTLPRYFAGQEKVGMTLTGGLDTRVITAWNNASAGSIPCYTFGGMFRDCQDVSIARRVAEMCGQPYQVIPVGQEFLSRFSHYAERTVYLTEGNINLYYSPDLYVSEKARAIAPAKVVGTYGSEIVRHAVMFKPVDPMSGLFASDFLGDVQRARQSYSRVRNAHPVTFAAFRQSPWYHYGILSLEQTQLTVRSPFLDNDFVRTVYRAPDANGLHEEVNGDVRLRLIGDGNSALARLRSDRGIGGNGNRLLAAARRNFLEFTFKAEYAYDYGMPQWVSRIDHLFSPLRLERLFLGRHKFIHFRVWYRDALASYVREMLLDRRTLSRPYLQRQGVEAIVRGHLGGGRNYTTEIHKLLTLELLHRQFFDAQ